MRLAIIVGFLTLPSSFIVSCCGNSVTWRTKIMIAETHNEILQAQLNKCLRRTDELLDELIEVLARSPSQSIFDLNAIEENQIKTSNNTDAP